MKAGTIASDSHDNYIRSCDYKEKQDWALRKTKYMSSNNHTHANINCSVLFTVVFRIFFFVYFYSEYLDDVCMDSLGYYPVTKSSDTHL